MELANDDVLEDVVVVEGCHFRFLKERNWEEIKIELKK